MRTIILIGIDAVNVVTHTFIELLLAFSRIKID